jgi:hypothetical protein
MTIAMDKTKDLVTARLEAATLEGPCIAYDCPSRRTVRLRT